MHLSRLNLSACIAVMLVTVMAGGSPAVEPGSLPAKVLFIGNSYTGQIASCLTRMLAGSSHAKATFAFITPGGRTLQQHLSDAKTMERIKTGSWDMVVLQEQSQTPALSLQSAETFHESVDVLSKLIRQAGAKPVLYMTWGRRDGDSRHPEVFPDFETMQQKLMEAYRAAAERNRIVLAPVGEAWSAVRRRDEVLGRKLYKGDGSHPSKHGAVLASCVLLNVLCHETPASNPFPESIGDQEWHTIKAAVVGLDQPDRDEPR